MPLSIRMMWRMVTLKFSPPKISSVERTFLARFLKIQEICGREEENNKMIKWTVTTIRVVLVIRKASHAEISLTVCVSVWSYLPWGIQNHTVGQKRKSWGAFGIFVFLEKRLFSLLSHPLVLFIPTANVRGYIPRNDLQLKRFLFWNFLKKF